MSFISNVIYGLKREYGKPVIVGRENPSPNFETGQVSSSILEIQVQRAIALPYNLRRDFLRSVGVNKTGYIEEGESEYLFDAKDITLDQLKIATYLIDYKGRKLKVNKIEDYNESYVAIVQNAPLLNIKVQKLLEYLPLSETLGKKKNVEEQEDIPVDQN